jgi:hypothetical protein
LCQKVELKQEETQNGGNLIKNSINSSLSMNKKPTPISQLSFLMTEDNTDFNHFLDELPSFDKLFDASEYSSLVNEEPKSHSVDTLFEI